MTETYEVRPAAGPIHGVARPPGSKSLTNRALVCAALADGTSRLHGALDSDDTRVMIAALQQLGVAVEVLEGGRTLVVVGGGGRAPAEEADLFVGNSGTTVRFLTAMLTLGSGRFRLDGVERMRQRPIGDLAATLRQLGADVTCVSPGGCPPVVVRAEGLEGGEASIAGAISSQYLSAVLMASPLAREPVRLRVVGDLVSRPYLRMTLAVMRSFGVNAEAEDGMTGFRVAPGRYNALDYAIEPDASAASYFWAAAAITGGSVRVEGLSEDALQGDVAFVDCLERMGCRVERSAESLTVHGGPLRGVSVDMNAISDTVQTLAAVALFAEGPTEITGVAHNRHKETDRITDLATELRKFGAEVDEREAGLRILPGPLQPARIATYDDHRMAMSLALVGLRQPGVVIENPGCTSKTYPGFFDDLEQLCTP